MQMGLFLEGFIIKMLPIYHFIKWWFLGSFVGSCTQELCKVVLLPRTDEDKDFLVETPHLSPTDLLWDLGRGKAARGQELMSSVTC